MIGSKALRGSIEATSAPPTDPMNAASISGTKVRGSGRMRRTYVAALMEVPQKDASLLVAAICTTEAPGRPTSSAGSCTSPPPPTTASTKPATSAASTRKRTTSSDRSPISTPLRQPEVVVSRLNSCTTTAS